MLVIRIMKNKEKYLKNHFEFGNEVFVKPPTKLKLVD
jgi:hypothetical protein